MVKNKRIKKELDTLWSKTIRARDKVCQVSGKTDGLNAHHIFTRSRMNTRWDLDNGILLSIGTHTMSSTFSAHKTPRAFFRFLSEKKGEKWLDDLEHRSQLIAKGLDLQLIKLYLEAELQKYE